MLFNSFSYLLFFPIVFILYFLLPKKLRNFWLLAASYFFYFCADVRYCYLLFGITLLSYGSGILLEFLKRKHNLRLVKLTLWLSVFGNLGILVYFKYTNFLVENLNFLASRLHITSPLQPIKLVLSLGISFILFQSISYIIDVYRNTITAEYNFLDFALYLAFFPKLTSGPIERADNILKQIHTPSAFSLKNLKEGLSLILLGLFYKLVLADNIASVINPVFASYADYSGLEIFLAVILFAFQIYGDFGGYSYMAIGSAKALGFQLTQNFEAPYFSESVSKFWRRWHITLNNWLRDYLYIPLGGNRKGTVRKYVNTMIVFLVSGLWHGADWTFVIWGGLNGLYIVFESIFKNWKTKQLSISQSSSLPFSLHLRRKITTFLLVDFAWLFFCMPDIKSAFQMIYHAITNLGIRDLFSFNFLMLFPNIQLFAVILIAFIILFGVDSFIYHKKLSFTEFFFQQSSAFRWIFSICLLYIIIFFGAYGEAYEQTQFIYFQF